MQVRNRQVLTPNRNHTGSPISTPLKPPVIPPETAIHRKRFFSGERIFLGVLGLLWFGIGGAALVGGWNYYRLPLLERPYSDLHTLFKPSGLMGHGMGIVGSLMMIIGVCMYSLRKRVSRFSKVGKLKHWLQAHIFLCTLGPFLVTLHTSFRIGGLVSIAFWSMALVVLSGIVGRYVYARIPKSVNGHFLGRDDIERHRDEVIADLERASGMNAVEVKTLLTSIDNRQPRSAMEALWMALRHDLTRRKNERLIEHWLALREVLPQERARIRQMIHEHLKTNHQLVLLRPFQQLFGYWHVFHLPLAGVMFLIMFAHVIIAALFGYVWVF